MRDLFILVAHLLTTIATLLGPGGARAVVANSLLMKQQLLVINRHRKRAPRLTPLDRFMLEFWSLFLIHRRIHQAAVVIRPSTLLKFHHFLIQSKYRLLYTSSKSGKPGPKDPSQEIINVVVELKRRNPRFGCPRIAQQINHVFGTSIDKDVVRRILATHYLQFSGGGSGPSWLTFLGHTKDSLWSVDLFRCESIRLKSHWVLVVMDQFTRRIIGFGVNAGEVDGGSLCCMFNKIISGNCMPERLSSDNDPLFRYFQWKANLRILDIEEIKTIPHTPTSHPFIERLIATIRREYLDQLFIWNAEDLERKLAYFAQYYNQNRTHQSLSGKTPEIISSNIEYENARLDQYSWNSHCKGLFQTPIAA